jgi:hypothetical protein
MREPRLHPLPPDPAERNGAPVAACRRIGLASNVVTRQQRCGAALVTSAGDDAERRGEEERRL